MRLRRWVASALLLAPLGVGSPACSSRDAAESHSIADAGPRTSFPDVGTPMNPVVSCADARCDEPTGVPFAERACCTTPNECGLEAPELSDSCRPRHAPGSVDVSCPSSALHDGTVLQGCCTPRGECGLFDRFGALGCVPPAENDRPDGTVREASVACQYDPAATCRSIVSTPCDGPEDCGGGGECCARYSHGQYDVYACFESCAEHARASREIWLEVCHPGEACSDPTLTCKSAAPLPSFLGRCYDERAPLPEGGPLADGAAADATSLPSNPPNVDAGHPAHPGISCGAVTCGQGGDSGPEDASTPVKCCLLDPEAPYCEHEGTPCVCRHEVDAARGTGNPPDARTD